MFSKSIPFSFSLFASVFLFCVSASAAKSVIPLGSEQLIFDPGPGNCLFEPEKYEFDEVVFKSQVRAQKGMNAVLVIYCNCKKLRDLRTGVSRNLENYGILLSPTTTGKLKKMARYTREKFLKELELTISKNVQIDDNDIKNRLNAAINDVTGKGGSIENFNMKQLGILAKDERAIYSGLIINAGFEGENKVLAAAYGMSLVKGYVLSYNFYAPYVNADSFDFPIESVKAGYLRIDSLNEYMETSSSAYSRLDRIDWISVLEKAFIGGLIGGVIALLIAGYRRFF